ncbi:MAG: DUF1080 domain-containing protein [Sedimentisphaerales bacterium]|nr:DUF1080 domain-containing protein [Sedimentisphaerales bacterium]
MNVRCKSNRESPRRFRLLACLWVLPLCSCATGPRDEAAQWRPLFNGRDLTGWTVKCKPADRDKDFWGVEDGTIVADSLDAKGHDYVWLLSDREYSDFILRVRFQAYRESPGNSGIQIRSRYDDQAGWLDGPQIDITPPGPWRTGMIWDETRGSKRWLYPAVPKGQWVNQAMANPGLTFYYADEEPTWNTLEIRAVGTKVTARLNDVLVTDYDGAGVLDDETHAAHNVGLRGHIALQIHINDKLRIRFKDIAITELPAP